MKNEREKTGEFTPLSRVELKRADVGELVMDDDRLRECPLVKAMGGSALKMLKQALARRYPDKVTVFRHGDAGDSLFLVLKGEARLFARAGEDTVEVGSAGKGEVFGEEEALGAAAARCVSAIAAGELAAVEFSRRSLAECGREHPELLTLLRELIAKRRAARDEIAAFFNRW